MQGKNKPIQQAHTNKNENWHQEDINIIKEIPEDREKNKSTSGILQFNIPTYLV